MRNTVRAIAGHWSLVTILNRLGDAGGIALGLAVAVRHGTPVNPDQTLLAGAAAIIAYFLAAELTGIYNGLREATLARELGCLAATWLYTIGSLLLLGFLTRYSDDFSRTVVLLWFAAAPVLMAAARISLRGLLRSLRARGWNNRRFAIAGANELGIQLARNLEQSPGLGLVFAGFWDDRQPERAAELPADLGACRGNLDDLVDAARRGEIHRVYITFPMRAEERIRDVLNRLGDTTASVYIVPDFFVFEMLHSRWSSVGGLPVVSVFEQPFYGVDGVLKRLTDVTLASIALAVFALPMAVIALLIKLDSPGPIFFRQRRYGLNGQEILVWKFRSMRVCEDGGQVTQASRRDPRVTRLGRILRRTSLDELPQLFNVLLGSMSLVGPRPHATAHNEQYRSLIQGYMLRHKVKPGITGWAQVNGWRGETDTLEKMAKRVEFDHQYIRDWSLWLDLRILLRTLLVVLRRDNAY